MAGEGGGGGGCLEDDEMAASTVRVEGYDRGTRTTERKSSMPMQTKWQIVIRLRLNS